MWEIRFHRGEYRHFRGGKLPYTVASGRVPMANPLKAVALYRLARPPLPATGARGAVG